MRIEKAQAIGDIFEQIKGEFKSKPHLLAAILVEHALTASVTHKVLSEIDFALALSYASGIMDGISLREGDNNETISGQI